MSLPVRFGVFEFSPQSGELTRNGTSVRLQPQPARVLAHLIAHAGELVTRDELRQTIWSDGTFVDFERGLNFCIAHIRSALGDVAESPRFIETVPRRGYRFVAPVTPKTDRLSGTIQPVPESSRPAGMVMGPRSTVSQASWIVLTALAIVTAGLVASSWRPGGHLARIAVVPFDNETGLDDFDQIARGVADATVARLATPDRIARLSVIGNAAALYQPRAFRDLKAIGTKLDADYIVLAQMKRDAARVRLIAHLIRVDDGTHVWANTFDRSAFTLDVQAEIAESIAAAVADKVANRPSHRS